MKDRQAHRRAVAATGMLFHGQAPGRLKFLGSCFSTIAPTLFLTAAHCIEQALDNQLWVNHHGGPSPDLFTTVQRVELIPDADLAVFETDAPRAEWASPFTRLAYGADYGEEVFAAGFPEELFSGMPSKQTMRVLRGVVQRPFLFSQGARHYSAFELSCPCPPGLSGGPVFRCDDPQTVIGVVTGNFESYTVVDNFEEVERSGKRSIHETRRVVTFGVASNIIGAVRAVENLLGRPLHPEDDG